MNEERLEAYRNLIDQLLACSSDEEVWQILSANRDLVDAGLELMMLEVANNLRAQGNQDKADYLMNLAERLVDGSQLNFLKQVLYSTYTTDGNAQVVYPLLKANTEKLNDIFAKLLRAWSTNILAALPEQAPSIVAVIGNFSNLIQEFPLGDRAKNMEIAITGYEILLSVFTQEAFPYDWAMTQNSLGNAYRKRILGDRASNIETAIAAFQSALTVATFEAFPDEWATTQHNLGIAYCDRILGNRADNIEAAIAAYQAALTVRTREALPNEWAMTQICLGEAYRNRILGDRANNIEVAIAAYQAALTVYTREAFPYEWAMTQHNLGIAYRNRILGVRADNIEAAIAAYQAALTVTTAETFPYEWARTQHNLGNAYRNRILGNTADNIEKAIAAYQAALTVRTREALPYDWAITQISLGSAYRDRILGERANNIEKAIAAYEEALTVCTREAFTHDWAMTLNNLGIAYRKRILGNTADNIEKAIAAYQEALTIHTREAWPYDWAMTQHGLGFAYTERILGDKADNIEAAINAYQAALTVYTREALPYEWAGTQNNLGNAYADRIVRGREENVEAAINAYQAALKVRTREALPEAHAETLLNLGIIYQDVKQFASAYTTFDSAIATVELLRRETFSGAEAKQKLAEKWNQLYCRMVEVCLELGKITEAIEYVERSKSRNLVELILERDLKTIFAPEIVTQLEKYRDEIAKGQYQLQNGKAEKPTDLAQHLTQLRQQCNELENRYLPLGYGYKFDQFQKNLDDRTVIAEFFITGIKLVCFLFTRQTQQPIVWQSEPNNLKQLVKWLKGYLKADSTKKSHWQRRLNTRLHLLAQILHIDEIIKQIPKECDRLILIPHRYLHLFPLHALPVGSQKFETSACLLDVFPDGVSYAPSCQLLELSKTRQRLDFTSLFAVQNPTEDLSYTNIEVETIKTYFNPADVLVESAATKAAIDSKPLNTVHCAHFSCHGYFNPNKPQKSALILANSHKPIPAKFNQLGFQYLTSDEVLELWEKRFAQERYLPLSDNEVLDLNNCLTLDAVFALKLEKCRLVTLSACETGLIDFNNISDEYIGLPSGFLVAGTPAVVSSLWTVNDLSTAFLMIKFYENLHHQMSLALALNQAQLWLRDITKEELQEWIDNLPWSLVQKLVIKAQFHELSSTDKPFREPYHWAAFCAIGQ